ncbi:MAG TPA: carboxypeptidase-like regulatory domain-containing protein, partial [Bryobacteraceae bacterium]|nr:carboxypeptidase-like regulatory domain-containing protein [Bryobacteraceae bacterium]
MNRPQRFRILFIAALAGAGLLTATPQTGTVRAADQFIPGAAVTANKEGAKVTTYTNASGRYSLDLAPGVWDIQVQMFGFTPLHQQVTIGATPVVKDWTLDMPRLGETAPSQPAPKSAAPAAQAPQQASAEPGRGGRGRGRGRGGRGGFGRGGPGQGRQGAAQQQAQGPSQNPAFQSAEVTATADGQQALDGADAGADGFGDLNSTGAADDALLVNGSVSGGLAAAGDAQTQRGRGRGGLIAGVAVPGGGLPPGMSPTDSIGLGGLGVGAIEFAGPAVVVQGGGFQGRGGRGGGGGRGGRGGGGGRGFGRGGRGRGPFNGQFATFGNRRRNRPAYNGSVFLNYANSALNAAPFSLNGQSVVKPSSSRAQFGLNVGGPFQIPKLVNWKRSQIYFTYQGTISDNAFNRVAAVPTPAERGGDFSDA